LSWERGIAGKQSRCQGKNNTGNVIQIHENPGNGLGFETGTWNPEKGKKESESEPGTWI